MSDTKNKDIPMKPESKEEIRSMPTPGVNCNSDGRFIPTPGVNCNEEE